MSTHLMKNIFLFREYERFLSKILRVEDFKACL